MTISENEVRERVKGAIDQLRHKDECLIEDDTHECSLTFRLGLYIQEQFSEYIVDCEYNRMFNTSNGSRVPKSIEGIGNVRPDIIVHQRRTEDNLLIIEMKKATGNGALDKEKIFKLCSPPRNYTYGLFLQISMQLASLEWCVNNKWLPPEMLRFKDE